MQIVLASGSPRRRELLALITEEFTVCPGKLVSTKSVINMQGVNALHQGVELDFVARPFQWLDLSGMFSIGNWRWDSNA